MYKKTLLSANFKHKIAFIQLINNQNLVTDNLTSKQNIIYAYADIRPLYEMRYTAAHKVTFGEGILEQCFIIRIRHNPKVHENMTIVFKGRNFEIKRLVNDLEKNRVMTIIALEITEEDKNV